MDPKLWRKGARLTDRQTDRQTDGKEKLTRGGGEIGSDRRDGRTTLQNRGPNQATKGLS